MSDRCTYCRLAFRVLGAKFGFSGVQLVFACPNCGVAKAETSMTVADRRPWLSRLLLAVGASVAAAALVSQFAD